MSQHVLTDCFISIDGTEYSGQNTNVAINMSTEANDVTPMGSAGRKRIGTGIMDWTAAMEFNADESITGQSFFDMLAAGEAVSIEVRPTSAARSATNPAYVGMAILTEYTPLGGEVGAAHTVQLSFVGAGELERLTVAA